MPAIGNKKSQVDVDLVIRSPVLSVEYHTFMAPGDGFVYCSAYAANGAYVGERCSPLTEVPRASASPSLDGGFVYIPTDAGGFVGDGSIAVLDTDTGDVIVYDPENAVSNSFHVVGGGYTVGPNNSNTPTALPANNLGFANGWLYWIESDSAGFRLRKCRCDGSGLATLGSDTSTTYHNVIHSWMQTDAMGAIVYGASFVDYLYILCPLNGGAIARDHADGFTSSVGFIRMSGGRAVSGKSIGVLLGNGVVGYGLGSISNANPPALANLWPLAWGNGNVSLNAAGTEASIYSGTDLVRNSLTTIGGSPQLAVTVQNHPSGAFNWPNLFFIAT